MISLRFASPFDFVAHPSGPDRDALLARGRTNSVPEGAEVFHAGSPGEHVYLLEDGRVKIFRDSDGDREIIQRFCFGPAHGGYARFRRASFAAVSPACARPWDRAPALGRASSRAARRGF